MGVISGNSEDKSEVFAYTIGENGAPLINDAKISIECEMDCNYELENFDNFICKILATYADDSVLNEQGKLVTAEKYFAIAGCNHYFGSDFMEKGMKVKLKEEPDNEYDKEAIQVKVKGLVKIKTVTKSINVN